MSPERVASLVARWARRYTRDLPADVAQRRIEELEADVQDQIAHERAAGTGETRIALGIAARMLRGLPADLTWRRSAARPARGPSRPLARIALVTGGILLVPFVGTLVGDGVDWSVFDFVFAALLLGGAGLLLELAARSPGRLVHLAAATAIGVGAILLGEADDAPGLVLFGGLLILGSAALAFRTAHRSP
jgi:hypothetical protein